MFGFSIIKLVIIGAIVAFVVGVFMYAKHLYDESIRAPLRAEFAAKEVVYKANEQKCTNANAQLVTQFAALKTEVDGITNAFKARMQQAKDDADAAIAKAQIAAKTSQPKIDVLRVAARTPTAGNELIQCRAAQRILTSYAIDVQQIRDMLGIVESGPTLTEPK